MSPFGHLYPLFGIFFHEGLCLTHLLSLWSERQAAGEFFLRTEMYSAP